MFLSVLIMEAFHVVPGLEQPIERWSESSHGHVAAYDSKLELEALSLLWQMESTAAMNCRKHTPYLLPAKECLALSRLLEEI